MSNQGVIETLSSKAQGPVSVNLLLTPQTLMDKAPHVRLLPRSEITLGENSLPIGAGDIDALFASIRERGFDTPLIVRRKEGSANKYGQYEIIDGRARFACALALGIETIPAIIVEVSVSEAVSLKADHFNEKRIKRLFGINLDQCSEALFDISCMIERDRPLNVKIGELDRIADGVEMEDSSILVDRGHWFDDILETLNWWGLVSDSLLGSEDGSLRPEPTFAHHREAVSKLMSDALAAFVPAWQENDRFTAHWISKGEATRELLKRYRTFTRYVCALAQEVWPAAELDCLLKRA